jgi:hypothetical protein
MRGWEKDASKGGGMREETKQEFQRKIAEKFEQALGPKPPAPKQISDEERQAKTALYADLLMKSALRQSR